MNLRWKINEVAHGTHRACHWLPYLVSENGAGDEIRTHDFNLGKVALYP